MELTHSSRTSAEHHIFAAFDTDGDGTIDLAEYARAAAARTSHVRLAVALTLACVPLQHLDPGWARRTTPSAGRR